MRTETNTTKSRFFNLQMKLIAMLSTVMLAILCLIPFTSSFAAASDGNAPAAWMEGYSYKQYTDYGGAPATLNGLQFDNGKMPLGMFGQNFFLGFDANGNFAVERSTGYNAEATCGAFDVTMRTPVYADGFSVTFSFDPDIGRGEPEEGGVFAIGLGDGSQNPYAFMYIVFRYNGESLDMYLIQYGMAHGYNVDAEGNHSCYNKSNLVELTTLATRELAKPRLDEKITLQLKKITKEEADIYNADPRTTSPITMDGLDKLGNEAPTTGKSAWRWIVNGVVIDTPAFSEAQEKGPMFDAYSLPKDENGDYYGYLWVDSNFRSGTDTGMLSSSNIDTTETGHHILKNLSGRITFYDIVTDGTTGGMQNAASEKAPMPGTTAGAAAGDYTYAQTVSGPYRGKTTVASDGAFSFQYTDKANLTALEMNLGLKKIDQPNGGSYRVLFKNTADVGTWDGTNYSNSGAYFGLILRKTAWRSLAVFLLINGQEYSTVYTADNPYSYDFKNSGEINLQLFHGNSGTYLLMNGRDLGSNDKIAAALNTFTTDTNGDAEGYIYMQNDSGSARVTIIDMITDGTAQQKTLVTGVATPNNVTLPFGAEYSNPKSVLVTFSDGSTENWEVTWDILPDTSSAQTYRVTGDFTNRPALEEEYLIPSDIIDALAFDVTVELDPTFIRSENLGTGYDKATNTATIGPEGYRWYSVYSVQIPYLYKQDKGYVESDYDSGYEHLMTDPSLTNLQFHTSDLVRKDVNGYELKFAVKNHSAAIDPDIYIMLTASPGHPEQIGQGNVGLHLVPSAGQTKMYANLVTWMQGAVGGLPEGASIDAVAYFQKDGEEPVREINFDFSGNTFYTLQWALSGEEGSRQVDMTLTTPDGVYRVVDESGNHISKADYQFNSDHTPTTLEPNGQFENEKGYLFIWVERGYNEIIFRQHYDEYVSSYTVPEGIEVSNNTPLDQLGLSSTIDLMTNKNVKLQGSVIYTGYDSTKLGSQDVTGTVTLPEGQKLEDNLSETFTVRVTVKGMITSVNSPQKNIEIKAGEPLSLSTKFQVTLRGDVQQEIEFVWIGDYDSLTPGVYELTAVPVGFYDYDNGVQPMMVKVTVTAAENQGGTDTDDGGCNSSLSVATGATVSAVLVLAAVAIDVCFRKWKNI